MNNVEFDADNNLARYTSRQILGQKVTPGMVKMIMKTGLTKNEKAAGYILIMVAVACLVLAGYFFAHSSPTPQNSPIKYYEDVPESMRNNPTLDAIYKKLPSRPQ